MPHREPARRMQGHRPQVADSMGAPRKRCANCLAPMPGRQRSGLRGRDIAWLVHCRECAALVQGQLELLEDRPGGAPIQIWACRQCGTSRSCRPGWATRCPVCLDARTVLEPEDEAGMQTAIDADPRLRKFLAETAEVPPRQVTAYTYREVLSLIAVYAHIEKVEQPGWTPLATDVHGLPFFSSDKALSHGTWARHDACGSVGKLTEGRDECRTCPPVPGSRTHRARVGTRQLLYLVRYLDLLKFGHGDARRVRAHLRSGCEAVLVLEADHQEVVRAETELKRRLRLQLIDPAEWNLPKTFGTGSEVVPDHVTVDLRKALATAKGVQDVTTRFQ